MLKSGDKVKRIHPLCEENHIKVGGSYTVNWVGKKRITLVGVPDNVWFLTEAFELFKEQD